MTTSGTDSHRTGRARKRHVPPVIASVPVNAPRAGTCSVPSGSTSAATYAR